MLENNEKIQGVNLSAVYSGMVKELPWSVMLAYINANANLLKMCTIGGHRLDPNKRERFEKIINREAEKANYSEIVCNGVFASWYPVHTELHKGLEDYFHSDEYKAYREGLGLGEDDYVLPDEKMDSMFRVEDIGFWRILLCFSPLKFTKAQADKILNNKEGSAELVDRLKTLEAELAATQRKVEQATAEAERLRKKQSEDANEIQELKKANRQYRSDLENTQRKLESSQAEIRHSSQRASEASAKIEEIEAHVRDESQRAIARVQNELDRVTKELQSWQSRYQEQKTANRQLEEGMAEADKNRQKAETEKAEMEKEVSECQGFADIILSRINWPQIGAAMKLATAYRKNLNSLLKKLNYEEDRTLTIEGTLPEFWNNLAAGDASLIKKLANSSMEELATGDINAYWQEVSGQFKDVVQNMEARLALLNIMQDLFFQTLEMSDLDVAKLPSKSKAKKKSE